MYLSSYLYCCNCYCIVFYLLIMYTLLSTFPARHLHLFSLWKVIKQLGSQSCCYWSYWNWFHSLLKYILYFGVRNTIIAEIYPLFGIRNAIEHRLKYYKWKCRENKFGRHMLTSFFKVMKTSTRKRSMIELCVFIYYFKMFCRCGKMWLLAAAFKWHWWVFQVNLRSGVPEGSRTDTCTAGAGSLLVEFGVLSRLIGDPVYEMSARRANRVLWKLRNENTGLLGRYYI